jgi:hypothetical protein
MRVTVELLGLARVRARRERVALSMPAGATLGDVGRALAAAYPELIGPVLTAEGGLVAGNLFSPDGRALTADLAAPLAPEGPEAHLLLLTSPEGG